MNDFHLDKASLPQKVLFTLFLLFMGMAYGIALLNAFDKTGLTSQGILNHYQGNETALAYPMSFSQLMDITHPHAFVQPLVFLAQGIIFSWTRVRDFFKISLYGIAFLGIFLDLSLPWLIRFGPTSFALFHILPGLFFTLSFLSFILVPLYEMWWHR